MQTILNRPSILDTEFAAAFDFAITRLVPVHLPGPLAAVREIRRVLKPGGKHDKKIIPDKIRPGNRIVIG